MLLTEMGTSLETQACKHQDILVVLDTAMLGLPLNLYHHRRDMYEHSGIIILLS